MSYALNISERNIISIREYCNTFLNIKYSKNGKLTHNKLREYAFEKGIRLPSRCIFQDITNEDILKGECYLVKDESGKIIAYKNLKNLKSIINDLEQRKSVLSSRREQILRCEGLKESSEGVISINDVDPILYDEVRIKELGSLIDKNNRIKRLLNIRKK